MVWYTILAVAVIGFVVWFVRTPSFRAHRHGGGKDPGDAGTRVSGMYGEYGASYRREGPPR
jgi:hypothetical protein